MKSTRLRIEKYKGRYRLLREDGTFYGYVMRDVDLDFIEACIKIHGYYSPEEHKVQREEYE